MYKAIKQTTSDVFVNESLDDAKEKTSFEEKIRFRVNLGQRVIYLKSQSWNRYVMC